MGTTINKVDSMMEIGMMSSVQKQKENTMCDFAQVMDNLSNKGKADAKTKVAEIDKTSVTCKKVDEANKNNSASEKKNVIYDTNKDKFASDSQKNNADSNENIVEDETISNDVVENVESQSNALDEKTIDVDLLTSEMVDEKTTDKLNEAEIVNALEMILQQIRQLLGVDDVQIAESVQNLGIETVDLINPENMPQLVADLTGEESTVGLIADEELYNSMQELTGIAENVMNDLIQRTGLTKENIISDFEIPLETLVDVISEEDTGVDFSGMIDLTDEAVVDETIVNNLAEELVTQNDNTKAETLEIVDNRKQPETKDIKETKSENEIKIEVFEEKDVEVEANKAQDSTKHEDKNSKSDKKDFLNNSQINNIETKFEDIEALISDNDAILDSKASTESIMRQLADFVKINSGKEITEMELQLHPASLGNVNVQLATKGGVVTAQFTTENETVRAAIEAQATQLKLELEEQGVKIEAIEVTVSSHEMEKNLDEGNQNNNQERQNNKSSKIGGIRKGSINLRAFESEGELDDEMQKVDDATRVAMEMMRMHGNTMSLLA